MPNQMPSGDPVFPGRPVGQLSTHGYLVAEWKLIIRMPGRIVVAATSADPDSPRRTVSEGLAGLDGIAAGRAFDSELVRAVATTIYAEQDADGQLADRVVVSTDVLTSCREVVRVLAARADPADSAAYRQWVQSIAARVFRAARTGGEVGPGADRFSPAERRFLADLGNALGLC